MVQVEQVKNLQLVQTYWSAASASVLQSGLPKNSIALATQLEPVYQINQVKDINAFIGMG